MRAFVALVLVFSIPSQKTGLGKRLQNGLFCVVGRITATRSVNTGVSVVVSRACVHHAMCTAVINVTLPDEKQNYVHRIGRVGRAERYVCVSV